MSEPTPTYNGARAVTCQSCGCEIGHYVQVGDKVKIKIGIATLDDAYGNCDECGAEWYWHSSNKQIEVLVSHVLEMRRDHR